MPYGQLQLERISSQLLLPATVDLFSLGSPAEVAGRGGGCQQQLLATVNQTTLLDVRICTKSCQQPEHN